MREEGRGKGRKGREWKVRGERREEERERGRMTGKGMRELRRQNRK